MAYDNFPLEAIKRKKRYLTEYLARGSWFTFYHDPFRQAVKIDAAFRITASWPQLAAGQGQGGD